MLVSSDSLVIVSYVFILVCYLDGFVVGDVADGFGFYEVADFTEAFV